MLPCAFAKQLPTAVQERLPHWLAKPRPAWEKTLDKVFAFIENNWDILIFEAACLVVCYYSPLIVALLTTAASGICKIAVDKWQKQIQLRPAQVLTCTAIPAASFIAKRIASEPIMLSVEIISGCLMSGAGAVMQWR